MDLKSSWITRSAVLPWHTAHSRSCFEGTANWIVCENNQICSLHEQLFSVVKQKGLRWKSKLDRLLAVFSVIVVWCRFSTTFSLKYVPKLVTDITVVQVLPFCDSTLLHLVALHFMWPLGDCKAPVLSFLSFLLLPSKCPLTNCLFCFFSSAFVRMAIHTSSQCPCGIEFHCSQTSMLVKSTHLILWKC